jgi:molecular chaperone HscB
MMNYFELLQIPVQLKPDKELVRQKYFEQSKKLHEDPTASKEMHKAQGTMEDLNKAYQTFNNSDETIRYVLIWKGLLSEEENYKLPPSFLLQVTEIAEATKSPDLIANPNKRMRARAQLVELKKEIYEPVKDIIENYNEGVTTPQELLQVKDYYFKKKYLHRLAQQLEGNL